MVFLSEWGHCHSRLPRFHPCCARTGDKDPGRELSQVFCSSAIEQKRLNLLLLLVVVIPVRYVRITFSCVSVSWLTIFIDFKEPPGYAFLWSKSYFYSWTNTYQDFLESELPLILSYSCLFISMSSFSWEDTPREKWETGDLKFSLVFLRRKTLIIDFPWNSESPVSAEL